MAAKKGPCRARREYTAPAQLLVTRRMSRLALKSKPTKASGIPRRAAWLGNTAYSRESPNKDRETAAATFSGDAGCCRRWWDCTATVVCLTCGACLPPRNGMERPRSEERRGGREGGARGGGAE